MLALHSVKSREEFFYGTVQHVNTSRTLIPQQLLHNAFVPTRMSVIFSCISVLKRNFKCVIVFEVVPHNPPL